MKRTPLARKSKNPSNLRAQKKQKQTKADFFRSWGITSPSIIKSGKLRYNGIKGIAWYWFAQYVRMRDFLEWGTCISCGQPKTFEQLQAGHFMPAGSCGLSLLMDERNVNGECEGCNGFDGTHLLGYSENLDKRYGDGTSLGLRDRYNKRHQTTVQLGTGDYEAMATRYKDLVDKYKKASLFS